MIIYSDNEVPNGGEPLDRILWQGRQWVVTTYGIEARNGGRHFSVDELSTPFRDRSLVLHMGGKYWVDIEDFATAYLVALSVHGIKLDAELTKMVRLIPGDVARVKQERQDELDWWAHKKANDLQFGGEDGLQTLYDMNREYDAKRDWLVDRNL
jgi:hypothetical protein